MLPPKVPRKPERHLYKRRYVDIISTTTAGIKQVNVHTNTRESATSTEEQGDANSENGANFIM